MATEHLWETQDEVAFQCQSHNRMQQVSPEGMLEILFRSQFQFL